MENFWDKRYAVADYLFGTKPAAGLIALEPHLVAGCIGHGWPGQSRSYVQSDMLAQAFSHMQITVNRAYTATLDEGRGHSGPSALIDFLATG